MAERRADPCFCSNRRKQLGAELRFWEPGLGLGSEIGLAGFPGGAVVKNLPANAGDTGSSPGLGRSHMPWNN